MKGENKKVDWKTGSYLFGITSIILCVFTPIVGLIFAIVGLVQAKKINLEKEIKLNTLGIILNSLFLILTILLLIFYPESSAGILI